MDSVIRNWIAPVTIVVSKPGVAGECRGEPESHRPTIEPWSQTPRKEPSQRLLADFGPPGANSARSAGAADAVLRGVRFRVCSRWCGPGGPLVAIELFLDARFKNVYRGMPALSTLVLLEVSKVNYRGQP